MKKYLKVDTSKGYPGTSQIYIECGICREAIRSLPSDNVTCTCRNIRIDLDSGRVSIKDEERVRFFETDQILKADRIDLTEIL